MQLPFLKTSSSNFRFFFYGDCHPFMLEHLEFWTVRNKFIFEGIHPTLVAVRQVSKQEFAMVIGNSGKRTSVHSDAPLLVAQAQRSSFIYSSTHPETILKKTHLTVAPRPHSGALPRRPPSPPRRPLHHAFAPPAGISTAPKRGSRSSSLSTAPLARRSLL